MNLNFLLLLGGHSGLCCGDRRPLTMLWLTSWAGHLIFDKHYLSTEEAEFHSFFSAPIAPKSSKHHPVLKEACDKQSYLRTGSTAFSSPWAVARLRSLGTCTQKVRLPGGVCSAPAFLKCGSVGENWTLQSQQRALAPFPGHWAASSESNANPELSVL